MTPSAARVAASPSCAVQLSHSHLYGARLPSASSAASSKYPSIRRNLDEARTRDSGVPGLPGLSRAPGGEMGGCISDARRFPRAPSVSKPRAAHRAAFSNPSGDGKLCCDKCDGAHLTEGCPVFRKPRENHPDALRRKPPEMGRPCGNKVVTGARVVRQPGDGSCLFHSMAYGLGAGVSAHSLRRELADWVRDHPDEEIAETPIKDWLWWDQRQSPASYSARMRMSGWGGGMELAACSRLYRVNIHVWERNRRGCGYRRISCFDSPSSSGDGSRTINVIYQGGVHYDALVV